MTESKMSWLDPDLEQGKVEERREGEGGRVEDPDSVSERKARLGKFYMTSRTRAAS